MAEDSIPTRKVTVRHQYSAAQVYDQVSSLNRQIARMQRYVQRAADRRTAESMKHDLRRLREIRDVWVQVEAAAQDEDGFPSPAEQLKQKQEKGA